MRDFDLLEAVQGHLEQIAASVHLQVQQSRTRILAGSLRFLINEGSLNSAWREYGFGGPIIVEAWCLCPGDNQASIGFAGGADILPGIPFSWGWGDCRVEKKAIDLKTFSKGVSAIIKGVRVSREELISYVANKKGAIHYDSKRGKAQEKIRLLDLVVEDGFEGLKLRANDHDIIHHEIKSICQSILSSEQVERLRSHVIPS